MDESAGSRGAVISARRMQTAVGWIAVCGSLLIACFWGFWGGIEAFHEGWYSRSFWQNVALTLAQYLGPMLLFVLAAAASVRWRPVGTALHFGLAVFTFFFFHHGVGRYFVALPLLALAACYWFGRPEPRRLALLLVVVLPVLTAVICGAVPAWEVAHRVDDGHYGMRRIAGNGVELTWAPEGPGWPASGVDWFRAMRACSYLEQDGRSVSSTPLDLWRLPTADEAVRSMARHGHNAGGVLDAGTRMKARYQVRPDKETPLWNPHSQVIYWWTSTETGRNRALFVSYNGWVKEMPKNIGPDYLAYRCVRGH